MFSIQKIVQYPPSYSFIKMLWWLKKYDLELYEKFELIRCNIILPNDISNEILKYLCQPCYTNVTPSDIIPYFNQYLNDPIQQKFQPLPIFNLSAVDMPVQYIVVPRTIKDRAIIPNTCNVLLYTCNQSLNHINANTYEFKLNSSTDLFFGIIYNDHIKSCKLQVGHNIFDITNIINIHTYTSTSPNHSRTFNLNHHAIKQLLYWPNISPLSDLCCLYHSKKVLLELNTPLTHIDLMAGFVDHSTRVWHLKHRCFINNYKYNYGMLVHKNNSIVIL